VQAIEADLRSIGAVDHRLKEISSDVEYMQPDSTREHVEALAADLKTQLDARAQLVIHLQQQLADADASKKKADRAWRQRLRDAENEFKTMLASTTAVYEQREQELNELLEKLKKENAEQQRVIANQQAQLASVRYAMGRGRELWQAHVLAGRKLGSKTGDCVACESCFQDADARTLSRIAIPAAAYRIHLFTGHPAPSYRIDATGPNMSALVIETPELFWRDSKCLIIAY